MLPENGGRTMDAICEMFNRFGFVFLHYVWGIRQLIPVYKNRSRAVGAIGALNQKFFVEETNLCIDGR